MQTGTTVLATADRLPGLTGTSTPCSGSAAVVAGLAMAALPARFALFSRLRWFAVGLLVLAAPLLASARSPRSCRCLLVLGCTVAPYMITTFTLGERVTARRAPAQPMTILAAATGLGYAVGAALAGRLADWGGRTPAYAVTVVAAALAVALSWAASSILRGAHDPVAG